MSSTGQLREERDGRARGIDVTTMTLRELGRTVSVLVHLRVVGAVVMMLLAGFLAIFDPVPWKLAIALGAALVLAVLMVVDRKRFAGREAGPRDLVYVLLTAIGAQTVLILLTGGIESPFIVIYLPLVAVASIALGRPSLHAPLVLVPIALVALFAAGDLTGLSGLTGSGIPAVLRSCVTGSPARVHTIVFAAALIGAAAVGSTIGLLVRRALDRAVRAAVDARTEAVGTMRERNRELVSLSGALAHELKNPLASIQGLAGVLARKLSPGSREAEQMDVLRGEVHRLGTILDEFLNFSRPAQGLATRPVAPRALLADVIALHTPLADERGIRVRADVMTERPLVCDARKIKQVVVNLLQNAMDATPEGGEVIIRVEDDEAGGLLLVVDDTGPGVADEVRGRLFTPGATTKAAGSGLGLTIARAITEQHGGTLTLAERPVSEGSGCRATVRLPRRPPAMRAGAGIGSPRRGHRDVPAGDATPARDRERMPARTPMGGEKDEEPDR